MNNSVVDAQLTKARELMNKYGLQNWRLELRDLSRVRTRSVIHDGFAYGSLGMCIFHKKLILIETTLAGRQQFLPTVKHEIAHALLRRPGHDLAWKEVARRVGCSKQSLEFY